MESDSSIYFYRKHLKWDDTLCVGYCLWEEKSKRVVSEGKCTVSFLFHLFPSQQMRKSPPDFKLTLWCPPEERCCSPHPAARTHTTTYTAVLGAPHGWVRTPSVQREAGQGFQAGDPQSMLRRERSKTQWF